MIICIMFETSLFNLSRVVTLLIKPAFFASIPFIDSPASSKLNALLILTVLGKVWVPPAAGIRPNVVSGILNWESVVAIRMSEYNAISNPEPMH